MITSMKSSTVARFVSFFDRGGRGWVEEGSIPFSSRINTSQLSIL